MSRVELNLKNVLYRFDCPSKMDLGEFEMGLLDLFRHNEISSHLNSCPLCTSDLELFKEFMSFPLTETDPVTTQVTPQAPEKRSLLEEIRIIVVDLLSPPAGVVIPPMVQPAMRGDSDVLSTRVLHIDPYVISISVIKESAIRIKQHLVGDIYPVAEDDGNFQDWTAFLWHSGNLVATSSVDEDRHFLLEDIPVDNDPHDLILSGPQTEIHLHNLRML